MSRFIEIKGPCPECGTQLNSKDEFLRHMLWFHKNNMPRIPGRIHIINATVQIEGAEEV